MNICHENKHTEKENKAEIFGFEEAIITFDVLFLMTVVNVFSNGTKDLCRRGFIENTTKPHVKSMGRIRPQCIAELTYIMSYYNIPSFVY